MLPTVCPDFHVFGPELREQAVETLGKYSLLGETAAVRHCPMLLTIALCEHEATGVRVCAMQVRRCDGQGGGGIGTRVSMFLPDGAMLILLSC